MHKRLLEDVMPLRIIREVEKWPVIYKRDSPEMINYNFKYKVWEEVAKNLFENFDMYPAADRQSKVNKLMKKWRNLRDTYKRQLLVEKRNREGHNIKRKEYVYFKHMSFLRPHLDDEAPAPAPAPGGQRRARSERHKRRQRLTTTAPPVSIAHVDEDKHFLLSLLPSFRRMDHDEKLSAKMDILRVIKDVTVKRSSAAAALDSLVLGDAHSAHSTHSTHSLYAAADVGLVGVVKDELGTLRVDDYKSLSESGSIRSPSDTECE